MPSIHLIPLHHLSAKGAGGGRGEEGEERRVSPKLRLIRELGGEKEREWGWGGSKRFHVIMNAIKTAVKWLAAAF